MKKFENLGKVLSKQEQIKIKGGPIDPGCLDPGKKCTANKDCCSKTCVQAGDNDPNYYCVYVP